MSALRVRVRYDTAWAWLYYVLIRIVIILCINTDNTAAGDPRGEGCCEWEAKLPRISRSGFLSFPVWDWYLAPFYYFGTGMVWWYSRRQFDNRRWQQTTVDDRAEWLTRYGTSRVIEEK